MAMGGEAAAIAGFANIITIAPSKQATAIRKKGLSSHRCMRIKFPQEQMPMRRHAPGAGAFDFFRLEWGCLLITSYIYTVVATALFADDRDRGGGHGKLADGLKCVGKQQVP